MKLLTPNIAGALTLFLAALTPLRAELNTGLVAHYPLNGNANDVSSNQLNGVNEFATSTTDRFEVAGQALQFNGATSRVRVPDAVPLRLSGTDFTISAWIYEIQRNADYEDSVVSKRNQTAGWIVGVRGNLESSTTGRLAYHVSGGTDPHMYSAAVLSLNNWHHVALVYKASAQSMQMFIGGVLDSTGFNCTGSA